MYTRTALKTVVACVFGLLLAGCEPGNDEGGDDGGRKITEIVGVFDYPNYEGAERQSRERNLFFYDDKGRLDRWICTSSSGYSFDLQFNYKSSSHITIVGTSKDGSYEKSIVAEIDLEAAGRVSRITDLENHDQTYYYSDGMLSRSVDERGYTMQYTWFGGDLTAIRVDPSPMSSTGEYVETAEYGSMKNIANLDLNHLAYETEYYCCMFFDGNIGQMLGMTDMLGSRSAHYVTGSNDAGTNVEWTFDEAGYPTELHIVCWYNSAKDMEARYTIYYND